MSDFDEDFELESAPAGADRLTLDLDGWEGPPVAITSAGASALSSP